MQSVQCLEHQRQQASRSCHLVFECYLRSFHSKVCDVGFFSLQLSRSSRTRITDLRRITVGENYDWNANLVLSKEGQKAIEVYTVSVHYCDRRFFQVTSHCFGEYR